MKPASRNVNRLFINPAGVHFIDQIFSIMLKKETLLNIKNEYIRPLFTLKKGKIARLVSAGETHLISLDKFPSRSMVKIISRSDQVHFHGFSNAPGTY